MLCPRSDSQRQKEKNVFDHRSLEAKTMLAIIILCFFTLSALSALLCTPDEPGVR